jgi:hypothetical protein
MTWNFNNNIVSCFAECRNHSEKYRKHSPNSLSSVTLGKEVSVTCTTAAVSLPSALFRTLDKVFIECHLVLSKEKSSWRRQVMVTEALPSVLNDTRQRSACWTDTHQKNSSGPPWQPLCRESQADTWQRRLLCREPVCLALYKGSISGPLY